jgi:phosphotriesterase-related protein
MIAAGFSNRVMLSHDRGWYTPATPDGAVPKPFIYVVQEFLPKLRKAGVRDADIWWMTVANPFAAFARI